MKERLLVLMDRRAVRVWTALILVLMVGAGCTRAGQVASPGSASSAHPTFRNLSSIAVLHDQFNREAGRIRLILLISPT